MPRPSQTTHSDAAAQYARGLIRALDLELEIPDRDRPRSPAIEWAISGAMTLTGPPEAAPRFAAGGLASAAAGAGLTLAALAPGTALESLDAPALLGERAAIAKLGRRGTVSPGGSARLMPTRRGTIAVHLPRDEDWSLVPAWLETSETEISTDRDWKRLSELVASRAGDELVERGRMMGLAIAEARETIPNHHPLFTHRHASERATARTGPPLRLLDLSNLWAGPLASSLLGMAGIEVMKIESLDRPDGARRGPRAFFDLMNATKRGMALDLRATADRARFERLLDGADIVVESARPRALAQLGFDAEGWVTESPGRLWASITGHGRTHEWIGFGDDAAVEAGLAWSPDPQDRDPCFCADAIADPIVGLHAAAIVLGHLRSGRGGLLDLPLVGLTAHAASAVDSDLSRPVEVVDGRWHAIEADQRIPIAAPRARSALGSGPALVEAEDGLLDAWLAPC